MEHIAMQAERREGKLSKGQRRVLRDSGHIMASVYGRDMDSMSVTVNTEDVRRALAAETGVNTLIDLTVDGKRHLARIAAVEMDTFSRRLLHIGFQKIKASDPIKATVPVELSGEPEAAHNHTARLEMGVREIEVRALPENMAPMLTLDISHMEAGEVLRAGDITLPEGLELVTDPEMPLVSLKSGLTAIPAEEEETSTPSTEATEEASAE